MKGVFSQVHHLLMSRPNRKVEVQLKATRKRLRIDPSRVR
jgi:hypothetical protein